MTPSPRSQPQSGTPPFSEELLHFSAKPLGTIRGSAQANASYKPKGFWVSVGPSWAEWCLSEEFGVGRLVVVSRIVLTAAANVLRLASCADLDDFTRQYGVLPGWANAATRHVDIDWPRVAESYDGIVIAPYQWERRHTFMWYYGWDCASGCLWRARTIASVESVDLSPLELVDPLSRPDDGGARP